MRGKKAKPAKQNSQTISYYQVAKRKHLTTQFDKGPRSLPPGLQGSPPAATPYRKGQQLTEDPAVLGVLSQQRGKLQAAL